MEDKNKVTCLEIVDIDDLEKGMVLTTPMSEVTFPLTQADLEFIDALKGKSLNWARQDLRPPKLEFLSLLQFIRSPRML
ncbi:MAG: hypothetical protein J0H12_00595 [Candidatus Paracaedimonas acanthamoebae]|uniref:Uncharacterized protein n=1 Tax=Candidatus Paracaedimonas acanthamoebae TaxID=244581 RepID=A0A8J7PZE7_9PROT|nr:hypothetical protein [Candidatus Paracaedimonas acanthamoebae]